MNQITTEQVADVLQANGLNLLDGEWDGNNPVQATRAHPDQPFARQMVQVTLESIKNYMSLQSGEFDPVAMGM